MSLERVLFVGLRLVAFLGSYAMPLCYMAMIGKFLEPRRGWVFFLLRYAAGWLMFNNVIFIGDAYNILLALPAVFLLLRLGCRCRGTAWLAVSTLFYTVSASLSALCDSGLGILAHVLEWWVIPMWEMFHWLFEYNYHLRMVVLLPAWLLLKRLLPGERYPLPDRLWRLVGLLAALPFVGTLSVVILVSPFYEPTPQSAAGGMLPILVMLPLFFLSALALLYTVSVLAGYERLRAAAELGRLNETYYRQMDQQQQQVRRLRHDMANHLTVLAALLKSGEGEEAVSYLGKLKEDPGVLAPRRWCGEPVIDAVLGAKAAAMEGLSICFQADIHLRETIPLEGPELCALLGNLLDNAMEACAKVETGLRQVRLRLRADRGLFILRLSNPCKGEVRRQGEHLVTSKADTARHGIGTESVRAIVEEHGGSVEFTEKDGTFECMLYLPLVGEKI